MEGAPFDKEKTMAIATAVAKAAEFKRVINLACYDLYGTDCAHAAKARSRAKCASTVALTRWMFSLAKKRTAADGTERTPPSAIIDQRLLCYCNFSGPDYVKRLERAQDILLKHRLLKEPVFKPASSFDANHDKDAVTDDASTAKADQLPLIERNMLDGKWVFRVQGNSAYLHSRIRLLEDHPPEIFLLLSLSARQHLAAALSAKKKESTDPDSIRFLNEYEVVRVDDYAHRHSDALEKHVKRIYGPGFKAVQKIPELYQQGALSDMSSRLYTVIREGQPFELAQRMLSATGRVVGQVMEQYREQVNSRNNGPRPGGSGP